MTSRQLRNLLASSWMRQIDMAQWSGIELDTIRAYCRNKKLITALHAHRFHEAAWAYRMRGKSK